MSARQIRGENGQDGTLPEWAARFSTEEACERLLFEEAHPHGWTCPRCGNRRCTPMSTRRHVVQCTRCGHQESLAVGTAMENTELPLTEWFLAAWLVSHSRRGMSGLELARRIGVCEKAGRNVLPRLRGACSDRGAFGPPGGEVEMDDLLLGATVAGGVGRGCEKRPLICAVERGAPGGRGRCAIGVVADCRGGTYAEFAEAGADVLSHVVAGDRNGTRGGLAGWPSLDRRAFGAAGEASSLPAAHHVISSFRAWVQGAFHGLSRVRLQGCADEFSWRCSQRGSGGISTALLRDCLLGYATTPQLLGSFSPQPSGGSVGARGRSGRERRGRVRALVEAARAREAVA